MLLLSGCQQNELEIYNETFHTKCTDDRNELTTLLFNTYYLLFDLRLDHVTLKRDKNAHCPCNLMSPLIFPIKAWTFG